MRTGAREKRRNASRAERTGLLGTHANFCEVSQGELRTESVSYFEIRDSARMSLPIKGGQKGHVLSSPRFLVSKGCEPTAAGGSPCRLQGQDSSRAHDWTCVVCADVLCLRAETQNVGRCPS